MSRPSFVAMIVLSLSARVAECQEQQDRGTPTEQFQRLLKEYEGASSSGRVLSDAERLKFIGQVYQARYALAHRFVALAEKYPDDPIALDALMQAVRQVNTTWPGEPGGRPVQ